MDGLVPCGEGGSWGVLGWVTLGSTCDLTVHWQAVLTWIFFTTVSRFGWGERAGEEGIAKPCPRAPVRAPASVSLRGTS
jgi:hypothetical protein